MAANPSYTEQQKLDLVHQALSGDRTWSAVARDNGISYTALRKWINRYGPQLGYDPSLPSDKDPHLGPHKPTPVSVANVTRKTKSPHAKTPDEDDTPLPNLPQVPKIKSPQKNKSPQKIRDNSFDAKNVYTEPGDNAKYLAHEMAVYFLPPIDIDDAQQVQERINWYFKHCFDADMKPNVPGLAMALGVDRNTLKGWIDGTRRRASHYEIVKRAYDMMEMLWSDYMLNGKINPASGIFLGRNHWNYQDQVQVVVQPKPTMEEQLPPEVLRRQIEALPDD